jgi:GNAT domain-containint protein
LTDQRADALFDWLQHAGRRYLWVETDRERAGQTPACVIETGTSTIKTTRLFTNLVDAPAFWRRAGTTDDLPALPLAGRDLRLTKKSVCQLAPLKTSVIAAYKDHFLKRSIRHSPGMWGYAVCLDGQIVGFLEFASSSYGAADELYLQSDFSFETHPYLRMSKLVLALAKAGETRRLLEKKTQRRVRSLSTTAFTDKPVSMKYRGVFEIAKRGVGRDGKPFINYAAPFDDQSWRTVYRDWFFKHAGAMRQELPA